ncbi:MAG TPA: hypothetical protein VFR67_07175 [Pilimelia sp.]|nr:hypothetical protein [Pilimelia sp.]
MIEIESRVADSLHARADRGIKVDGLHGGAVARAGRIRRRRRAAAVVAATGLAAVLTAGIAVAPRLLPVGGTGNPVGGTGNPARPSVEDPAVGPPGPAKPAGPATVAEAPGVPAAAERPTAVGTDPRLLHFDLNLAALNATSSDWVSGPGYEGVVLPGGTAPMAIEVLIGPNATQLQSKLTPPGRYWLLDDGTRITNYTTGPAESVTINGRPGTFRKLTATNLETLKPPGGVPQGKIEMLAGNDDRYAWVLAWQPVDGLNAVVSVRNRDKAVALTTAEAMRLGQAQRCAVPVTVTHVPAGATLSECRTAVRRTPIAGRGAWILSHLKLRKPAGGEVSVWLEEAKRPRHKHDTSQFDPDLVVAGHPARWLTDPLGLWILNFGAAEVFVSGVGKDEAVRIAGGLQISTDLFRPQTWPLRPVG